MDSYSLSVSVGAVCILIGGLLYWPLRDRIIALRPNWLKRGLLGWTVGSWWDAIAIFRPVVFSTGANSFWIHSIRLFLAIGGSFMLAAQLLYGRA